MTDRYEITTAGRAALSEGLGATEREKFCAVLASLPRIIGDAIVVLSGDGVTRVATGADLYDAKQAKTIVVSGGLDNPPHSLTAEAVRDLLLTHWRVPASRIDLDATSLNTREQAENIVIQAMARKWTRLILVTSAYHAPRVALTFIQCLYEADMHEVIRLVVVPASNCPWWMTPEGLDVSRIDLLSSEFTKVAEYQARGDVATWSHGLAYLAFWEAKMGDDE